MPLTGASCPSMRVVGSPPKLSRHSHTPPPCASASVAPSGDHRAQVMNPHRARPRSLKRCAFPALINSPKIVLSVETAPSLQPRAAGEKWRLQTKLFIAPSALSRTIEHDP